MKERTNQPPQAETAGSTGAEMALRESEWRLAHAMSLAQLADWEYDVARGLFTFSDRYYALHGTTSELEGGNMMSAEAFARKFVHPDDAHSVGQEIAKAVAAANADYLSQVEARILRRDGEVRHVLVRISIAKNTDGRTIGLHGTNQDITESKRVEERVQEGERRLRAITGSAQDAILMMDPAGRITYWNPAAERILGYTSAEAIGQDLHGLIVPVRFLAAHKAAYPAFLKTGRGAAMGKTLDLEARRKDGQEIFVQLSLSAVQMNDGWHAVGIIRDATERKKAELEIQHQATFARFNPNPVLELSANSEIAFFNGGAEAIARALGLKDPAQILPPDTAEIIRECLAAGTPKLRVETRIGPRVISWSFFPIKLTNAVHCYGTDITEEKRLLQDLLATSRMAGMDEVATSVLHDVGNVLNSVNVSSAVIADKMRGSKIPMLVKAVALLREHESDMAAFLTANCQGKLLLDYLAKLADHLTTEQTQMVKELSLLTKNIDHIKEIVAMQQNYAKVSGVCEMVSPADLVEDALNMNDVALDQRHIELVRQYSKTPAINVEQHKVLQILVNLIRNAKYACDESRRADKRLTVAVGLADDHRVRISVIDNGIGISAENQPRIFNHGFTTRRDGHGFGLHSGALAAKELGGSMTMHSDGAGKGATFTLELPLQPPRVAPAKAVGRVRLDCTPPPGPNGNDHLVAAGREHPSPTTGSRDSLTRNIRCHALLG